MLEYLGRNLVDGAIWTQLQQGSYSRIHAGIDCHQHEYLALSDTNGRPLIAVTYNTPWLERTNGCLWSAQKGRC